VFENLMVGEMTASLLEHVMDERDQGIVPPNQIVDSRYQDLIDDPVAAIGKIYRAFDMEFDDAAAKRIRDYLAFKPKHKHGVHRYQPMDPKQVAENRPYFRRYQERYAVRDENG
jgi:hypothetical protein